jgi:hypothetical protein
MTWRFAGLIPALVVMLSAADQPVSLTVTPGKPRTLVGEGITLQVRVSVQAPLSMETVELNRSRTRLSLTRVDKSEPERVLTGADHIRLFRVEGLTQIGRSFRAAAGQTWTGQLDLFQYTRPLAAGRYRLAVAYQYGNDPEAVARAAPVEFEVVPTTLLDVHCRQLECVWRARDGQETRLVYEVRHAANPDAVVSSAMVAAAPAGIPVALAQPEGLPQARAERYLTGMQDGKFCYQSITARGVAGRLVCVDTGLSANALLADPVLHTADGGMRALLIDGAAGALLQIGSNGRVNRRSIRPPAGRGPTVVAWREPGEVFQLIPEGTVSRFIRWPLSGGSAQRIAELPGSPARVFVEQWQQQPVILAVSRDERAVHASDEDGSVSSSPLDEVLRAVPYGAGKKPGWVLWGRREGRSAVVRDASPVTVPVDPPVVSVLATRDGAHVLRHDPHNGFRAELVTPAAPARSKARGPR